MTNETIINNMWDRVLDMKLTKANLISLMNQMVKGIENEDMIARIEEINYCMTLGRVSKEEKETIKNELYDYITSAKYNY